MVTVRARFEGGAARPVAPVNGHEGEEVTIVFDQPASDATADVIAQGWRDLLRVAEDCKVDTGTPDLAREHDHYLYGTPKHGDE